jgi:hypothetical protein
VAPLIERAILRFMYAKDEVVILLITTPCSSCSRT